MSSKFNLVAELQIQAPKDLSVFANDLNSKLKALKINNIGDRLFAAPKNPAIFGYLDKLTLKIRNII